MASSDHLRDTNRLGALLGTVGVSPSTAKTARDLWLLQQALSEKRQIEITRARGPKVTTKELVGAPQTGLIHTTS